MTDRIVAQLEGRLDGRVTTDAPLGPQTTFRVGGHADVLLEADSEEDLLALAEVLDDADVAVIGRGSNLLVSDEGFRGVVVKLGRGLRQLERTELGLSIGGAVYLPAAARATARFGLTGFEFAAEIPGSFGGAVRMNAGAHDRSIADVLVSVSVVDLRAGERRRLDAGELDLSYRRSAIAAGQVVTIGELALDPGDPEAIGRRIAAHLTWRREAQPGGLSAGSVFKNPPGDAAGRLIDEAGGKLLRVGGAKVSEVHANFIVAEPGARASDVFDLMLAVRDLVADRTGVVLEPEVQLLGSFRSSQRQPGLEGH